MSFTLEFIEQFALLLFAASPLVGFLMLLVVALALFTGRVEGWSLVDSLYYGFITATTVGFGDMRPTLARTKMVAIVIGFSGLMLTGMAIALAVEAMNVAHDRMSTAAVRGRSVGA